MRQHPGTLAERRLTVDTALDGPTHAAMANQPHRKGNPLTSTDHPLRRGDHGKPGLRTALPGFPFR